MSITGRTWWEAFRVAILRRPPRQAPPVEPAPAPRATHEDDAENRRPDWEPGEG